MNTLTDTNDIVNDRGERIATVISGDADRALRLINRADVEQSRRHYTKAARLNYQADQVAKISWAIDETVHPATIDGE